jgi:alpha-D-xyloside xylohydrolase
MMRAVVMDFPKDKKTWDLNNEFLFGKSILVVPVTNPQYLKRVVSGQDSLWAEDFTQVQTTQVYLPAGTNWFDFWTGKSIAGGQTIQKETPLDIIPLYVKAGSIVPFGPNVQYAEEKRWDSLDISIYPGANGEFVFYEDENDNYNYEKGLRSTITFKWNNASKTFTIGDRKGSFPGMLKSRKFNITVVDENAVQKRSKTISYSGNAVSVKL